MPTQCSKGFILLRCSCFGSIWIKSTSNKSQHENVGGKWNVVWSAGDTGRNQSGQTVKIAHADHGKG